MCRLYVKPPYDEDIAKEDRALTEALLKIPRRERTNEVKYSYIQEHASKKYLEHYNKWYGELLKRKGFELFKV